MPGACEQSKDDIEEGGSSDEDEYSLKQPESPKYNYESMRQSSSLKAMSTNASSGNLPSTIIDMKDPKYKPKPSSRLFPLCIVWTPLPCFTQLIPIIGHTGIGDSKGVTHDFAGPYYISVNDLAFGETHKYVVLDLEGVTQQDYDSAIMKADNVYKKRMHNICCDNCHSHVARVLNILEYQGRTNYTMIDIWWMCLVKSKYVSVMHILFTYVLWIFIAIVYGFSYLFKG